MTAHAITHGPAPVPLPGDQLWYARQLRSLPGWQLYDVPDDVMLEACAAVIALSDDDDEIASARRLGHLLCGEIAVSDREVLG
ncbi:hypothetical protein JF540_21635 [Salipiger thiooxidans]|uniref:hypothetical protein n=1 Tax=Salipiger thiooxidans TaxID=282683 RepID=UPI001A8E027C|nr:hypothetical protein [Salipiger thiooxidans]MBN8189290.1 hypothetical protein [Salipiger thiooxidans]